MKDRILPLALSSLMFTGGCSTQLEQASPEETIRYSKHIQTETKQADSATRDLSRNQVAPRGPAKKPKTRTAATSEAHGLGTIGSALGGGGKLGGAADSGLGHKRAKRIRKAKKSVRRQGSAPEMRNMRGLGFVKGHTRSGKARRPAPPQQAFAGRIDDESLAEDIVVSGEFKVRSDISYNKPTQTNADPLSTFSIDVDTAAYSIARRSLMANQSPTPSLVRVEEMINYFKYNYDAPSNKPFAIQFDGARSPVDNSKHILRVGIQSKKVSKQNRLPSNIVFLVDTSCSMTSPDKLDLAKSSIRIAVENLGERDKVAITTYAGGVSLVLPPTSASQTHKIFKALDRLQSSGGTAMSSGMQMAYQQAALMLRPETNTRVVVLSDGDANIGAIGHRQMLKQIKGYVSEGVRMTTIGYGDGNYKDETMEQLANKGNGNYYYIDSPRMAARVFGRDLTQMLQDVAQDVKIQVEFNPKTVKNYRLVGYENRKVADQDFRNDDVDAGEIGAGHQVTALYELTLKEGASNKSELATVRVRAKKPMERKAKETARRVEVGRVQPLFSDSPDDFQFATAVMGGAELLRNSPHAQAWNFDRVLSILDDAAVSDSDRQEFVKLMKIAKRLAPSRSDRFSSRQ